MWKNNRPQPRVSGQPICKQIQYVRGKTNSNQVRSIRLQFGVQSRPRALTIFSELAAEQRAVAGQLSQLFRDEQFGHAQLSLSSAKRTCYIHGHAYLAGLF